MPIASTSLWSRLTAWLRGSATPSAPTVPPTTPTVPPLPTPPPTPVPVAPVETVENPHPVETATLPTEGVQLDFRRLWRNHPTVSEGETFPCRDEAGIPHFDNQCAILMGTCLARSELLHGYDRSTCWYRGHKGHTLRAREVAEWLRSHPERFGRVEIRRNVSWGAFKGRTGIICFQNFWGQGNQGDHIDLWDGTGILRRELDPTLEGAGLADGALDYFERSQEVWFWPVY